MAEYKLPYTAKQIEDRLEYVGELMETGIEVDLSDYAKIKDVPKNTSQLTNDSGFITTAEVGAHNVSSSAHSDIRLELGAINDRLNAFFDSDNQTLDELSEIVAYITSNKELISAITDSKVNVKDIIDNLTTNVANKPLSAA